MEGGDLTDVNTSGIVYPNKRVKKHFLLENVNQCNTRVTTVKTFFFVECSRNRTHASLVDAGS